jgi:hypothetical protein
MDSKHWDWGKGYCRKHLGNGVPCQVCIATNDPDLDPPAKPKIVTREMLEKFIGENPCVEVHDAYERDRAEWAERVSGELDRIGPTEGEYFDWKSVRPVGEPIKGSWASDRPSAQNIPRFGSKLNVGEKVKGIFVIEGYDGDGNLVERISGENTVSDAGFEKMLEIDFSKLPPPTTFLDPTTGHWMRTSGDPNAAPERWTEGEPLPPRRANLPNVAECDQPVIHEARFKKPVTLQNGDSLLVRYTVRTDDPNIETETRVLTLAERLQLVADQHRQRFLDAGVEDPDDLLRLLGAEELLQPTIPGFELPKKLPRRVPIDMELIGTIVEAEGCSDELRAALMAQIAIYGAPTICGLLAEAGIDEEFIDSLTSNL